jgi:hypothetical protein
MKRRFYRATLPTIVWDPNENKALAKFINGTFTTEDEDVAEILLSKGYPEVGLDQESPPMIIPAPVEDIGDVRIMPAQMTEDSMAKKIKRDGMVVAEEQPSPKAIEVNEEESKPRRVIKRRSK